MRQLLTHTGGVPEQAHPTQMFRTDYGESVQPGRPAPTLAEYYRGGLRVAVEPGTSFIYGDHSFATLGQIVQDVTGTPLHRYFCDHIFEPLGMTDTSFLRPEGVRSNVATGYELARRGPRAVIDRELIPKAAGAIYSTTRDMARYVAALLGGGANGHGAMLQPATLATMFEPHYRPDVRLPGMGLGFMRGSLGGHLAVEHQGIVPGFNAQLWVAPNDGVGIVAFTNGSPQAVMWMPGETGRLLGDLLGVAPDGIRTDMPQHPEVWGNICGWYKPSLPATDVRARLWFGAGAEVLVRRGQLVFRLLNPIPALYRGLTLHPDDERDPYAFRIDLSPFGMGTARVVFGEESSTRTAYLEFMPNPFRKQPAGTNPRLWATAGLAVTGAAIAGGLFTVARRG